MHQRYNTHVNRHLVDVHALLNAKLRDQDVERSVENADNLGGPDDGTVLLRQVGDEDAEEEVSRLLLSELRRVAFAVTDSTLTKTRTKAETAQRTCCIVEQPSRPHLDPW